MHHNWYYSRNGREVVGPCTSRELVNLAASKQLAPDDMVGRNRKVRLVKASSVKGLFAAPKA
jgi:hypothetical protein